MSTTHTRTTYTRPSETLKEFCDWIWGLFEALPDGPPLTESGLGPPLTRGRLVWTLNKLLRG